MRILATKTVGFNPYFSGCFSLSSHQHLKSCIQESFNPYFSGCFSLRIPARQPHQPHGVVSILIFLDASL